MGEELILSFGVRFEWFSSLEARFSRQFHRFFEAFRPKRQAVGLLRAPAASVAASSERARPGAAPSAARAAGGPLRGGADGCRGLAERGARSAEQRWRHKHNAAWISLSEAASRAALRGRVGLPRP